MANAGADADAAHLQMLLDHAERAEDHHATFEEASVGALDDSHVGINVAVASDVPIVTSGTDGPTTGVIGSPQVIVAADADATDRTFDETRLQLDKCVPELLPWLMACRTANDGAEDTPASADDAFFFLETNHPELVHTNAHDRLFEWMTSFMLLQHPTVGSGSTALEEPAAIERFPASVQAAAVEQLAEANDSTSVANEFGLKSTLTLHYWAHMQQQQHEFIDASVLETPLSDGLEQKQELSGARANGRFYHQTALLDWISSHQGTTLTRQDVLRHIVTTYPEFAASKSVDTLKTWIGRLLKRHLPATTASGSSSSVELGADEEDHQSDQIPGAIEADSKTDDIRSNQTESPSLSTVPSVSPLPICGGPIAPSPCSEATDTNGKRRQKRGASDRYVTHSNEFKLNALQKLDEGFSISEVAEELGLKSQNTLAYWSSIRDKLVMSEKKRFRLAGGGRRSSCSFEEELLTWVTERYQRGEGINLCAFLAGGMISMNALTSFICSTIGTDVKSVLEYLQEFHPSFTDGKKEPTLRKWILRFFKRCWRAPSTSNDVEKSCMFV